MTKLTRWIGEQWPIAYIPRGLVASANALRTTISEALLGRPYMTHTRVDYDLSRSLYRNDHPDYNLGAGFVRPIIDLPVEYMGLPYVTSEDGTRDTFLNEAIHDHWGDALIRVLTAIFRDSKVVVRFRQPRLDNPLFTEDDRMHGRLEVIAPEVCHFEYDPTDPDLVTRVTIHHWIDFDETTQEELLRGESPRVREHEILEIITPVAYKFYDKTDDKELTTWETANSWRFVPCAEIWNEWDATLGSGQSDIEPVLPFIKAFHDVLTQALTSHRYHSAPKAKFKLRDITSFLASNFPDVLDPATGRPMAGAKVSWTGKEIFFMESEEDIDFIEATSVLGDSKTLLEFLIDCIAIAAETPKWALLKTEVASKDDASIQPFEKKIERKRRMFIPYIQLICKMNLAARSLSPVTPRVTWPTIRVSDLVSKGQAIQQIVMSLDVASTHQWVSDETVVQILATLFPEVSSPEIEMQKAKTNFVPLEPAPAPASDTQGAQSTNGTGPKSAAKKAIATTSASNS